MKGGDGERGGTGLYISTTSESATRSGALGGTGNNAGFAFVLSTSTARYYSASSPQAKALGI